MFQSQSFARSALAAAVVLTAASCWSAQSPAVSSVSLEVFTQPSVNHQYEMTVGERVRARVSTETDEGCMFDPPCEFAAVAMVTSSAPGVIALDVGKVTTPGEVWLTGKSVGSSIITAGAGSQEMSLQVYVVAAPSTAER